MIIFLSSAFIIQTMMNELANNPLFQSALAPFVVALVTGYLLRPLGSKWVGLGFVLGYGASVYFTAGFQLFPLTSTRKIELLAVGAVLVGVLLDHYKYARRPVPWVLAMLAIAAAVWVIFPVLKRAEGLDFWLMLFSPVYVAWMVVGFDLLRNKPVAASTAAVSVGVGTSISAVLGASALLGQLGGAIGAAAGAIFVLVLFVKRVEIGSSFTLPVALLAALLGISAVIYAGLSWYALVPLALIPLATYLPVNTNWNRFIQAIVLAGYSAIPAAVAIAVTWKIAQAVEPSLY